MQGTAKALDFMQCTAKIKLDGLGQHLSFRGLDIHVAPDRLDKVVAEIQLTQGVVRSRLATSSGETSKRSKAAQTNSLGESKANAKIINTETRLSVMREFVNAKEKANDEATKKKDAKDLKSAKELSLTHLLQRLGLRPRGSKRAGPTMKQVLAFHSANANFLEHIYNPPEGMQAVQLKTLKKFLTKGRRDDIVEWMTAAIAEFPDHQWKAAPEL
jgi:hypothetical protein